MKPKDLLFTHADKWRNCELCEIGKKAFRHCAFSIIPATAHNTAADILIVGEGPGESENVIGKPFVGLSGAFLRKIIHQNVHPNVTVALSNLVMCRPVDAQGRNRPPSELEISNCSPRLAELIYILDPAMILCLGRVPTEYVQHLAQETAYQGRVHSLCHPAYVLRQGGENWEGYRAYVEAIAEDCHMARDKSGDNVNRSSPLYRKRFVMDRSWEKEKVSA